MQPSIPDARFLRQIAEAKMPFGRYKDRALVDIPEPYLAWLSRQGFPSGELGQMLAALHELKKDGLAGLLRPLVPKSSQPRRQG